MIKGVLTTIAIGLGILVLPVESGAWELNPADFDRDGVVGLSDLMYLQSRLGGTGDGDLNQDGQVDRADVALLARQFGYRQTWDEAEAMVVRDFRYWFLTHLTGEFAQPDAAAIHLTDAVLAADEVLIGLDYLDEIYRYRFSLEYALGVEDSNIHSVSWYIRPEEINTFDIRRGQAAYTHTGDSTTIDYYEDIFIYSDNGTSEVRIESRDKQITQYWDGSGKPVSRDEVYVFTSFINQSYAEFTIHTDFDAYGDIVLEHTVTRSRPMQNDVPIGDVTTTESTSAWEFQRDSLGNKVLATQTFTHLTPFSNFNTVTTTLYHAGGQRRKVHVDTTETRQADSVYLRSIFISDYDESGVQLASVSRYFNRASLTDNQSRSFLVYREKTHPSDPGAGQPVAMDLTEDGVVDAEDLNFMESRLQAGAPVSSLADFDGNSRVDQSDADIFRGFIELTTPPMAAAGAPEAARPAAAAAAEAPQALTFDLGNWLAVRQAHEAQRNAGGGASFGYRRGCREKSERFCRE